MAIVVFMPFLVKIPVAVAMKNLEGKYDNRHPRTVQSKLEGFGARAMAVHNNCFEAITYFAPTILLVLAMDAHTVYTAQLCVAFVLCRLAYVVCYWANWHIARSSFWILGIGTVAAHYFLIF